MTRATMLRNLRAGSRVRCNVRGRVFWATLARFDTDTRAWQITPPKGINYYHVTTRQIEEMAREWSPESSQVRKST